MKCERFLRDLTDGCDSPEMLGHLRGCESCMNAAAEADGQILFRALGGDDLVPPGGVDAFVSEVMQQVHMQARKVEIQPRRRMSPIYGWAVAATLIFATSSFMLRNAYFAAPPQAPGIAWLEPSGQVHELELPVIEHYENAAATIVEVPTDQNFKLVMIFDETLPVDL